MADRRKPALRRHCEHDLIRRLCHALDIARFTVEHLAAGGYTDARDSAKNVRAEKIIAETAVLLLAASEISHREVEERVKIIAQHLAPHARSERAMLGMCLEPCAAWEYAMGHLCLNRLGFPDSAFDELLHRALKSQASAGRERVPHRMLEKEWAALGLPQHESDHRYRNLIRLSVLNHPLDVLACSRDDLYAFTHALMYTTDFGRNPRALPRPRDIILAEAEAALAHCLDEQDYDLAGEILLSWPLTGKTWSSVAAFAFRVLTRVEDKAGFLPTPATRISEIEARTGLERTHYRLATAYHTAYVMGLLCAASLRSDHAPPIEIRAGGVKRRKAKHLLRLLDFDGKYAHWRDEFGGLADREVHALAGFLLHIAFRRRMSERDYTGMLEVLRFARDLKMTAIPSATQAAELLERLAAYSEAAKRQQSKTISVKRDEYKDAPAGVPEAAEVPGPQSMSSSLP